MDSSEVMICPFCREEVIYKALVCKSCGSDVVYGATNIELNNSFKTGFTTTGLALFFIVFLVPVFLNDWFDFNISAIVGVNWFTFAVGVGLSLYMASKNRRKTENYYRGQVRFFRK